MKILKWIYLLTEQLKKPIGQCYQAYVNVYLQSPFMHFGFGAPHNRDVEISEKGLENSNECFMLQSRQNLEFFWKIEFMNRLVLNWKI